MKTQVALLSDKKEVTGRGHMGIISTTRVHPGAADIVSALSTGMGYGYLDVFRTPMKEARKPPSH